MTDNAPPLRTLTLDEAAAFFQVHKSTVRERAKAADTARQANEHADFVRTMYTPL